MRLYDMKIDAEWAGPLKLCKVTPFIKDDVMVGFNYHCLLDNHELERVIVKILGEKLLEISGKSIEVEFTDLFIRPYAFENRQGMTATATGIKPVHKEDATGK